jgi:hypothetical protein
MRNTLRNWHHNEEGQVAFLFTFSAVTAVCLLALVFNTATQTIRKTQMQNATDAAALAAGINVARGLNLIAFNNQGMVQMVSTMIVVRATLQTAEAMVQILPGMAAAVAFFNPGLAAQLEWEYANYLRFLQVLRQADQTVTRFGWQMMNALDRMNQAIKASFPALAQLKAVEFARLNGADQAPHSLLIPGLPATPPVLFPAARGPQRLLVIEAEQCTLKRLKPAAWGVFFLIGPVSSGVAIGIYEEEMVDCNVSSLKGGAPLCGLGLATTPPLTWPANPPRPMILTDAPARNPAATVEVDEARADLAKVRRYLQLLAVSFGKQPDEGAIGAEYFQHYVRRWLTYAEANVYNPSNWSLFKQDWRAKLVPARVFNEKLQEIGKLAGFNIPAGAASGLRFINTH